MGTTTTGEQPRGRSDIGSPHRPDGDRDPWRPRRHLDPELARAVGEAKKATGMTWREVGARIGVVHSHLVMISRGYRVPSRVVAELIGEVLPIDDDTLEDLMDVAVLGHGRSRHRRPGDRP